ncbi:S1C family serine protease [Natronococcus occultus]|uniref:Trypsin-like serine protease with C-terminal PDZ domain n=1 Tax=Natronococcus occultus SP4 TaxID=694430 RepID=L0K1V3_9EURY|nr:trypsin-like peptidase domain-containing protein [Natronococcus occultus]AGB38314.1 trypsin-like serine protease with C-terminal PDZ domain [Natronococcus occultus SP4]
MRPDITRRRLLGVVGAATGFGSVGTVASAQEQTERYAEIYDEAIDAVVLVNVSDDEGPEGLGSGFVVDDYAVTNDHVVGEASEVELQFRDEQWRTASVVGSDVHSDLAVLELEDVPDVVSPLSFTESEPTVGQEALALGNPLGLDASISQGLVSGIDRSLPSPTGFSIPAAIQTDAPVNPGNSGGPLVDLDGDVLGVVFAGAGQTIGFAISAALADRVVPALAEDGEYDHAYLGVNVIPVSPPLAEANELEDPRGVLVAEVVPDSPAEDVLEPVDDVATVNGEPVPVGGDAIIAIDGEEIPNQEQLAATIALETSPGETVAVEVIRDGERETVELELEPRPDVDVP